jgi:membrane associated rhomboid family serine protease
MREPQYSRRWSAAIILIIVNVVVYAAQLIVPLAGGVYLEPYLALTPTLLAKGWVWQLLTFQFLHSRLADLGLIHLTLNCVMLYMFGRPVEQALGRASFVRLYVASGTFGGLLQAALSRAFPGHFGDAAVVGASAGVFGIIAAFAALNWDQPITTLIAFIIPVTMPAKYLVVGEVIIAGFGLLLGRASCVAHGAHLGGILAGLAYVQLIVKANRDLLAWARPKTRPRTRTRELVGASTPKRGSARGRQQSIPDDLPPAEFISREVDPILDKISAHGIQSLTDRERRILEAARAKISRR